MLDMARLDDQILREAAQDPAFRLNAICTGLYLNFKADVKELIEADIRVSDLPPTDTIARIAHQIEPDNAQHYIHVIRNGLLGHSYEPNVLEMFMVAGTLGYLPDIKLVKADEANVHQLLTRALG